MSSTLHLKMKTVTLYNTKRKQMRELINYKRFFYGQLMLCFQESKKVNLELREALDYKFADHVYAAEKLPEVQPMDYKPRTRVSSTWQELQQVNHFYKLLVETYYKLERHNNDMAFSLSGRNDTEYCTAICEVGTQSDYVYDLDLE